MDVNGVFNTKVNAYWTNNQDLVNKIIFRLGRRSTRLDYNDRFDHLGCRFSSGSFRIYLGEKLAEGIPLPHPSKSLLLPLSGRAPDALRSWRPRKERRWLSYHRCFPPLFPTLLLYLDVGRRTLPLLLNHQGTLGLDIYSKMRSTLYSLIFWQVFDGSGFKRYQYYLIGYGVPVVIVSITLGATNLDGYITRAFNKDTCNEDLRLWVNKFRSYLYF